MKYKIFIATMMAAALILAITSIISPTIPTKLLYPSEVVSNSPPSNLFDDPSLFLKRIRYSKKCDTSQQKSWEMAVAARYNGNRCISPHDGDEYYHGPSGPPGSSLHVTKELRVMLQQLFKQLSIKTFFDAPCGDWLWMQTVNLTSVQYFGGDITNITIQKNRQCFERDNVHFHWFDLTCMIPPAVDFILVRDALFHLPEYLVQEALSNINNSGAKYFATTTFSVGANGNWNSQRAYMDTNQDRTKMNLRSYIGYQKLNPFNFPPPLFKVEDMTEDSRHVGIWSLPILPMNKNKHKEGISGLTLFDSDKNNKKLESKIVLPDSTTNSSVIFGVFYIPIENNTKHPLSYYHTGLQQTCSFLRGLGHPAIALGDPDKLRSVPGCGWLTEVEGGTYRIKDLRYINESSIPIRHGCYIKFTKSPPKDDPLLQQDILQIWLNKIDILADLADSYQDKLVVLVDAGLRPHLFPKVKKIVDEGLKVNNLNDQSLAARMYSRSDISFNKAWFGKEQCTTPPKVCASILAIRGRAGNHMRAIFKKKVSETAMLAEKNDTCPCYDEEIILSSIYDDDMSLIKLMQ